MRALARANAFSAIFRFFFFKRNKSLQSNNKTIHAKWHILPSEKKNSNTKTNELNELHTNTRLYEFIKDERA